jgi:hypothetical protein
MPHCSAARQETWLSDLRPQPERGAAGRDEHAPQAGEDRQWRPGDDRGPGQWRDQDNGHAAFFEMKEADEPQFVKLYLAGIQQTAKLTAADLKVFELVFRQMREHPQTDKIELNRYLVKNLG